MQNELRKLILGDYPFVPSHIAYKRIMITGILSLLTIVILLIFLVLDQILDIQHGFVLQFSCILIALACFFLNRNGYHTLSKILLAIIVNLTIYVFSECEPLEIGLFLFFVVTSIGAMAVFGFEEPRLAIFFTVLPMVLFLLSLFTEPDFFPKVQGTQDYIRFNILINFILAFGSASVIIYFMVNLNQVSEKALRENELQIKNKNEELTRLNLELDRFVYSTSHDLRSPISSMLGLINLTKSTNQPEEIAIHLELMEGQLIKLSKFIRDISDYSRNARVELSIQEVNIKAAVDSAIESMRFIPGVARVKIYNTVPCHLQVTTDPTRLQMILSNLLSNSFKYADFSKAEPYVKISTKHENQHLQINILDNGVGIDPKLIDRIFDMFFQAHDRSEGSGLGLYIVKEAVTKLRGTIAATSTLGQGSGFSVTIPETIGYLTNQ